MKDGSRALVDRFADRLDESSRNALQSLHGAGEWHFMLNELCAVLTVGHVPVTADDQRALADYLRLADETDPRMKWSSSPDTTLAALNVIDR